MAVYNRHGNYNIKHFFKLSVCLLILANLRKGCTDFHRTLYVRTQASVFALQTSFAPWYYSRLFLFSVYNLKLECFLFCFSIEISFSLYLLCMMINLHRNDPSFCATLDQCQYDFSPQHRTLCVHNYSSTFKVSLEGRCAVAKSVTSNNVPLINISVNINFISLPRGRSCIGFKRPSSTIQLVKSERNIRHLRPIRTI